MDQSNIHDQSMRDTLDAIEFHSLNHLIGAPTLAVGTTTTKFKLATFTYKLGGVVLSKTAADSIDFPGFSTGAAETRKVLVCIDNAGAVTTVGGDVAATQAAAVLPDATAGTIPVAVLELPASFTSGTTVVTAGMCKTHAETINVSYT